MSAKKKIVLVAHDEKKQDLLEWARYNKALLMQHELSATGTTGTLLEQELEGRNYSLSGSRLLMDCARCKARTFITR